MGYTMCMIFKYTGCQKSLISVRELKSLVSVLVLARSVLALVLVLEPRVVDKIPILKEIGPHH